MTSKLTRERLEKIKSWRETYGAGSNVMLPAEEAEELARIALAAMDSEPVAFINGAWTLVYYRPPKESGLKIGDKLYRHAQQPVVPATLPCSVELKPSLIIGKGCKTETLLTALRRRADYNADIDAMTPEERAEHDASIKAFKAMLAAAPQTQNIPEIIPEKEDPMTPADREYIVKCYSYTGPAWLHAGKDGPAWHFEGSDLLVDNDEVTVICKLVDNAEVK